MEKEVIPVHRTINMPSSAKKRNGPSSTNSPLGSCHNTPIKRGRTKQDFLDFCGFVLKYTEYQPDDNNNKLNEKREFEKRDSSLSPKSSDDYSDTIPGEEDRLRASDRLRADDRLQISDRLQASDRPQANERLQAGRITGSQDDMSSSSAVDSNNDDDGRERDVTCYCKKPFANRPMIECSSCETWIHLSCAKIRKNHIPEVFICAKCRDLSNTARKSPRIRTENKKFTDV